MNEPLQNKFYLIEFTGMSGVGKSYLYNILKDRLSSNTDYIFIEKSFFSRLSIINIPVLIDSLFKIARCRLTDKNTFIKYSKLWYFTQVYMAHKKKLTAKYIIIDEGPFHRTRAIRSYSQLTENKVRKVLFDKRTYIPDIVLYINAKPEIIFKRRQERGAKLFNTPLKSIHNDIEGSYKRTLEDIQFVNNSLKGVKLVMIDNHELEINNVIDSIINRIENTVGEE